jgi:hypothetical protein
MKPYYFILDNDSATVLCQVDTAKEAQTIAEKEAIMHPSKTFRILKCIGFSQTSGVNTFWMDGEEPKQEPQYRMLEIGEIRQEGDEFAVHGNLKEWDKCEPHMIGDKLTPNYYPHRRPITPNNQ